MLARPARSTCQLRRRLECSRFTTSARRLEELAGTAPSHTSYILLATRIPPPSFPRKVPSKLQRTLQLRASQWGGLVNFAWDPSPSQMRTLGSYSLALPEDNGTAEWDTGRAGGERYTAMAFSAHRGTLVIPEVSLHNLDQVAERLREHALLSPELDASGHPISAAEDMHAATPKTRNSPGILHLYVCTHGQRDCRCGETGGAVFATFREEVERRGLSGSVAVGGVGHVGGHKYAANVLVFPYGEWLGKVTPDAVPAVLDAILALRDSSSSTPFDSAATPPLCPLLWRGRMGLAKGEQLQLISGQRPGTSIGLEPHPSRTS